MIHSYIFSELVWFFFSSQFLIRKMMYIMDESFVSGCCCFPSLESIENKGYIHIGTNICFMISGLYYVVGSEVSYELIRKFSMSTYIVKLYALGKELSCNTSKQIGKWCFLY